MWFGSEARWSPDTLNHRHTVIRNKAQSSRSSQICGTIIVDVSLCARNKVNLMVWAPDPNLFFAVILETFLNPHHLLFPYLEPNKKQLFIIHTHTLINSLLDVLMSTGAQMCSLFFFFSQVFWSFSALLPLSCALHHTFPISLPAQGSKRYRHFLIR